MNLFRDQLEGFPKGRLVPSESPDFILNVSARYKIGIELTSLHSCSADHELVSYENISACLEAKDDKLYLYRKRKLNEYWLVISVNDLSSWNRINLHNKILIWNFITEFNRIFLINTRKGRVFELNHG